MYDIYTLEKLQEFQQSELQRLERKGLFVKPDPSSTHKSSRYVKLLKKLYGFFRKRRSRASNKTV